MEIGKPTWYLKKICPCCGQGCPSLVICPHCSYVTAWCEEMGDMFLDAKDLDEGFSEACPNCKQTTKEEFRIATSEEITKAGFAKDDYQ